MTKARVYVVTKLFEGMPKRSDFEIVERNLPPLKNGEILIKTEWISVDPYQRAFNGQFPFPYYQRGHQLGIVEESKHPEFPVGVRLVSHQGWCDYSVLDPDADSEIIGKVYKLPDLQGLPIGLGLGAIGMPGETAYSGLLEICKPKEGETVVVTGAAGGVGSLVGQIAKIKGCKVIGFAGSDDKVSWLEKELGFNRAFNYKTVDVAKALKEAAPFGVDCYFDNVGGEISSTIINHMTHGGRVSICGSISSHNENPNKMPMASVIQSAIVFKQLKVEGFICRRFVDKRAQAFADIMDWIKSGKLKAPLHITEGFEKVPDAFLGMLLGHNFGKAVVKV